MTSGDTSYQPGKTVEDAPGTSPVGKGTAGNSACYPGLLAEWSTGTYGNGVVPMTANYGDSQTEEGEALQIEIPGIHPRSQTAYDKSTVYTAGDSLILVTHVVGQTYWVKGSSITTTKNKTKLIPAGSGLVKAAIAHTATPLPMHMWLAKQTVASGTWLKAKYLGIVSSYTSA